MYFYLFFLICFLFSNVEYYRPVSLLKQQTPSIIKALHRQLKEKSIKTRQGCFLVLTELVTVLPNALSDHIPALIPGIQFSLGWVLKSIFIFKIFKELGKVQFKKDFCFSNYAHTETNTSTTFEDNPSQQNNFYRLETQSKPVKSIFFPLFI